ncbi:hypothetical protein D3C80_1166240 [compost metagenome]
MRCALWSRSTRRSPCTACSGALSCNWANMRPPGSRCSPCNKATRALTSWVPRCTCTGLKWAKLRTSLASNCSSISTRWVGPCSHSASSQSPRRICASSRRSALMFNATRCPAHASGTAWFWACSPRTRTGFPALPRSRVSPNCTWPSSAVPVTTIPAPATAKARSMARRKPPRRLRARISPWASIKAWRRASTPSPVMLDNGNCLAPA